ncbi:MAG: hypothetical protein AB7Q01_08510 [Gammaproteobacteria bacterium]
MTIEQGDSVIVAQARSFGKAARIIAIDKEDGDASSQLIYFSVSPPIMGRNIITDEERDYNTIAVIWTYDPEDAEATGTCAYATNRQEVDPLVLFNPDDDDFSQCVDQEAATYAILDKLGYREV